MERYITGTTNDQSNLIYSIGTSPFIPIKKQSNENISYLIGVPAASVVWLTEDGIEISKVEIIDIIWM